mgnify:CR=1 FL=1
MAAFHLTIQKKGQVFTPSEIVDLMVEKLFQKRRPAPNDRVLDPGCGTGAFIKGILNWCERENVAIPCIVGVESDPQFIKEAQKLIVDRETITVMKGNFLLENFGAFDFIIGNPPYVRIDKLSEPEREMYRKNFETAVNRFDLYMLFFEKALKSLKTQGRLVFITPEKYEYTLTARPLRKLMSKFHVEEIHHVREDVFRGLVTYPTITTINRNGEEVTKVIHRDGASITIRLPTDGSRWISVIRGESKLPNSKAILEDICMRISSGVATGEDKAFIIPKNEVPEALRNLAHPTVSGKDLTFDGTKVTHCMLIPYDHSGKLLPEEKLGEFRKRLSKHRKALNSRYCVRKKKHPWYAFHENPPMGDILRAKILFKDIAKEPKFWLDEKGKIVPQHSVYYLVPKDPRLLPFLLDYLNSEQVRKWVIANCQRAANDFIRLQSSVLRRLPIPENLAGRENVGA